MKLRAKSTKALFNLSQLSMLWLHKKKFGSSQALLFTTPQLPPPSILHMKSTLFRWKMNREYILQDFLTRHPKSTTAKHGWANNPISKAPVWETLFRVSFIILDFAQDSFGILFSFGIWNMGMYLMFLIFLDILKSG